MSYTVQERQDFKPFREKDTKVFLYIGTTLVVAVSVSIGILTVMFFLNAFGNFI